MVCRLCRCTEAASCPEGCAWVGPELCSSHIPIGTHLLTGGSLPLDLSPLALLVLHGNLGLALRQPENAGPPRAIAEALREGIEGVLLEVGVFTPELLEALHMSEAAAAPRVILARG